MNTQILNMKVLIYLFVCFNCLASVSFAQTDRKLTAYLQTKQFVAPGIGNYLEIHIQYVGPSIKYTPLDNGLIGELAVYMKVYKNDSIINSDAYRLKTPFMVDSIIDDFYDVKRFALDPGTYKIALTLQDLNSSNEPITTSFNVNVEAFDDVLSLSDIIVAESASPSTEESPFFKSGYTILPKISTYYPEELTSMPAYFEIYNMNELEDSVFGLKQTIIHAETGQELEKLTRFSRHSTDVVVPIFRQIDLTSVPTGKYTLNYTLLDRDLNELATQSYEFERSNEIEATINMADISIDPAFQASISSDSVDFYLASLIPISKPSQVRMIVKELKTKNEEQKRLLLQAFWVETAGITMYEDWLKYKTQVIKVQQLFASNYQRGYETDRGRVYLQYGPPARTVERENSPSEYPWEIWEYNKIGVFSNRKFIFYNPDLINNQYRLLHSDMVGELKNPRWSYELSKRNTQNGNVDNPDEYNTNSWGNNSREFGQ